MVLNKSEWVKGRNRNFLNFHCNITETARDTTEVTNGRSLFVESPRKCSNINTRIGLWCSCRYVTESQWKKIKQAVKIIT